jgi:predicted Zn-dependent protease
MELVRRWLTQAYAGGVSQQRIRREEWLAWAQSGQLREAGPHLAQLLTDPGGDAAEICEAYVYGYMRTRQATRALQLLESWIADFPNDPRPHLLRGRLRRQLEQLSLAEQDLRRALALAPDSPEIAIELADVLQRNRQPVEALGLFLRTERDPRFRQRSRLGQARCRAMLGETSVAERLLDDLLREAPEQAEAWAEAGRVRLEAGRPESALTALRRASDLVPRDLEVRYQLAQALQATGANAEAREHFDHVERARQALSEAQGLRDRVDRDSNDVEARYRLGVLLMLYDDPDEAAIWLLGALDIDPAHIGAHAALADHYRARAEKDSTFRELAEKHRSAASPSN